MTSRGAPEGKGRNRPCRNAFPCHGVRIGISGWAYKPWRGDFHPAGLAQNKELAYAASIFRSIEINGTFYCMQRPEVFEQWADGTPADFVFAVKGPRYLTHMLKLRDARSPISSRRARSSISTIPTSCRCPRMRAA